MTALPLVDVMTHEALLRAVRDAVERRSARVFVGLYAACWRAARHDTAYAALLSTTTNYPDGQGVVAALRRAGHAAERLATTDFIHAVLAEASTAGWRVLLYGGTNDVVTAVRDAVAAQYTGLQVVGAYDGFSDLSPSAVGALRPDLVLVARGAPLQEEWASRLAVEVGPTGAVGAIMTCGGLFDFLAGRRSRAPVVLQRAGLEWAYRAALEPRRLLGRYLRGNTYFLYLTRVRGIPVARGDEGR